MRSFHLKRNGVLLEFQEEPEGGYTVTLPDLPGCVSYGDSVEHGLDMIKDAIDGWIEVERGEGVSVPAPFNAVELASL